MAVRVYISYGGSETEWDYQINTLAIHDEIGSRLSGSVGIYCPASDDIPVVGQPIRVADDSLGNLIGGTIDQVQADFLSGTEGSKCNLTILGWDALMDRHGLETSVTYTDWKAGLILKDLFANTTISGESVVTGLIIALPGGNINCVEDGPTITITLANQSIASCVSAIIGMCAGYYCKIDSDKVLQFHRYATIPAPFGFSDGDVSKRFLAPLNVTWTREKYANRFVGVLKAYLGDTVTENIVGDGATRSFFISQPIAITPTIAVATRTDVGTQYTTYVAAAETVIPLPMAIADGTPVVAVDATPTTAFTFAVDDAFITMDAPTTGTVTVTFLYHTGVFYAATPVAVTVGPAGGPTANFYWTVNSTEVTQDAGLSLITSDQFVQVTYQSSAPQTIVRENAAEIAARAAIEGGTGIYTQFWSWDDPISSEMASASGQAYVDTYCHLPAVITGSTRYIGLQSAMGATFTYAYITLADGTHPLNSTTFILQSVDLADFNGQLRWGFKAVNGALVPFGIQALAELLGASGGASLAFAGTTPAPLPSSRRGDFLELVGV